jgi:uncharacterized iron-regulated membrane protein
VSIPALSIPALVALCAVPVLVALVAGAVLVRRRRCARLCTRFVTAATAGQFDEAEAMARRWFDATTWTGLSISGACVERLARLRLRRGSRARAQSRPDVRRRSVS